MEKEDQNMRQQQEQHPQQVNQNKVMSELVEEIENNGYEYECGDCAKKVFLKPQDPVRCFECGHRILYKPRTRRVIQYEAR